MTASPQCALQPPLTRRRTLWLALTVLVLLLAAGLRFHRLGAQSLWNDEGASVAMTARAPGDILTNAAADIHPPGYYLLLKGWAALAGTSEFALRFPSALASILTVALTFALGKRLFGPDAGAPAALLLAANTFAIYYAQEARMYALLGLWAAAGMWALVIWIQAQERTGSPIPQPLPPRGAEGRGLALVLINAAGLYTQYAYPLTLLAQGAMFLAWWGLRSRRRAPLLRYTALNALSLLLFAPWAGEAIRQVTTWPNSGAGTPPAQLLATAAFGLTLSSPPWPAVFAALACAAMGLHLRRTHPLLALPAVWAAVTLGGFAALRLQPDDLKQLTPAATALAVWLGAGLAALWRDRCAAPRAVALAASAALALTLIGALPALYTDPAFQRDDYRRMAAAVSSAAPDAAVILNGPGQGEVWAYYYRGAAPVYPLPRGLGGDDAATRAEVEAILRDHRRVYVLYWGERERDPNGVVEGTLNAGAFEVSAEWVGRVRFVTYAAPGEAASAPTATLDLRFSAANGDALLLAGYALDAAAAGYAPGDALTLTLFWRTDAPPAGRYKVFVHLFADPDAPPPAQHDGEPGGGLAPTPGWTPGATVIDRHGLLIPAGLAPGEYTLAVGVYAADDPATRLSTPQGERVAIATVRVTG